MDSRHAALLVAFRGLDARQRRLLDLAAHARGTVYEDKGMKPWWPGLQRDPYGRIVPIPCHEREPGVQSGVLGEKTAKLIEKLCGVGRLPSIRGVPARLLSALLDDLDLVTEIEAQAFDLVVKGACCGGAALVAAGGRRRLDPVYVDPVFAQPFWPSNAGSPAARRFAESLEEAGLGDLLGEPLDGEYLEVPEDAGRRDLVALRYEPMWLDEDRNEVWRTRTDYLPNAVVKWRPMRVLEGTVYAPSWEVSAVEEHGWGFVPLSWVKAPGGHADDTEGPSFLTPEMQRLAYAVDLALSMRHDSVRNICLPQLTLIDVVDKVRHDDTFAGLPIPQQEAGSGTVMEFESSGDHPSVSVTEPTGAGLGTVKDFVADLLERVGQLAGLAEYDQAKAAGALSGVALERLMEPTVARVKRYQRPLGRYISELAVIAGRIIDEPVGLADVQLNWPRVISPSPEDVAKTIAAVQAGCGGSPVISHETAVHVVANILELPDPEAEWERVQEAMQEARDQLFPPSAPPAAASQGE
jgi:hypothetical protein